MENENISVKYAMNFYKNLTNPLALLQAHRLVKNSPFKRHTVRELQFQRLKKLLVYAYENIDFYRDRMDDAGFSPYNFTDMAEYQKLPPLTKTEYREYTEKVIAADPDKYKTWHKDGTSGSTGTPMEIYRTWQERAYILAKWLRAIMMNGYSFRHTTCLVTRRQKIEKDSLAQYLGFGKRHALCFTEPFEKIISKYQQITPDFLYANKSHLLLLAKDILDRGLKIKQPRLYAVASETLDKNAKAIIQSVFGQSNMFEVYGAIELGGNLAFQIKGTCGMHFCHDTNILELDNNGVLNEKEGACIITDLYTKSFPLIRYRLGDWIKMQEAEESMMPLINSIKGREDDWIFLPNGKRISFIPFLVPLSENLDIVQFRIIQEVIDKVKIQIVIKKGIDKDSLRNNLIEELKKVVSPELDYIIEYREQLPPDPNGKLRVVINTLKEKMPV